jgi:subtilase family serine protease
MVEPCGTQLCTGIYIGVGGTSLSAPLMAGIYATIQQGYAGRLGHAAPYLYSIYARTPPYRATFKPTYPYTVDTLPGELWAWRLPGGLIWAKAILTLVAGNNTGVYAQPWQYNFVTGLGSPNAWYLYQILNSFATTLNLWQRTTTYAYTPTITWPGTITISVWVNIPSNMSGKLVGIASTMTTATTYRWSLVKSLSDAFTLWLYTPSGWAGCGGPVIQFNTWYHIVATYNNATGVATIYYNGKPVANCTLPKIKLNPAPLYIGYGAAPAGTAGFTGYMTNLQIYSTAITPQQAYALYLAGPYGPTLSAPLIAWYPLSQLVGDPITEKSGPAATMTGTSYQWTYPPTYPPTPTFVGQLTYQTGPYLITQK